MTDDANTDRVVRFDDGERVGAQLTYRANDGAGYVVLIVFALGALFAFAWACAL